MNKEIIEGISVIVCCFNSESKISKTLLSLFNQSTASGINWEIIVVDNASTDNTSLLASTLSKNQNIKNISFKIIHEPKPGLSNARRCGVLSASHSITIFCDDDNWLDTSYVQKSFDIMSANTSIGMLGGAIIPVSDVPLPSWFYTYGGFYAVGVQGINSGDITERGYVWGAGCVLRTSFLKYMYNSISTSALMGREGGNLAAGDDSEIAKWVILSGYKLWFDEELKLSHYMPEFRLQKNHLTKTLLGGKFSTKILSSYDFLIFILGIKVSQKNFHPRVFYRVLLNFVSYMSIGNADRKLILNSSLIAKKYSDRNS